MILPYTSYHYRSDSLHRVSTRSIAVLAVNMGTHTRAIYELKKSYVTALLRLNT